MLFYSYFYLNTLSSPIYYYSRNRRRSHFIDRPSCISSRKGRRGKEKRRRSRKRRACVRTLVIPSLSSLWLLFLCRNKKRRRREREKEDGCSRQKDPCVCMCKNEERRSSFGLRQRKKEDQPNKQSPWLDKGEVRGQKTSKLRVATKRT